MILSAGSQPADDHPPPCPPAPGPLEDYATQFDPLLASVAQRRGLRDYLQGLLLPRDRNKTLTALAGAEPITGAQHRQVQRLQWFLSESTWDHEAVNQQRIELLQADPVTAPHAQGVLVIDDTGDRKDGTATAHVARQYLGSVGKTDNGIVAVTSLWADARCYWPLHLVPYTPASRLPRGKSDPGVRTKPQLAAELVAAAQQAKIPFRAVVADCFYGDNPGLWRRWVAPGWRSCWPSSPARASGHPMMSHTPRWRRPASSAGVARGGRVPGGGSPAASATVIPRPGGPPTLAWAAGVRTAITGWWWPPPTQSGCPS
jgi:DDE superfamily endonuclease